MQHVNNILEGEYCVSNMIAEGYFGQIYSGVTKGEEGKKVALKVIPFSNVRKKNSFAREAGILQKLRNQQNIITLDTWFYDPNVGVLVLEQMDCDLLEYVLRKRCLSEDQSKLIFIKICEALKYCHSIGITHLDIKPENILIKYSNIEEVEEVKLADFGYSVDFSEKSADKQSINFLFNQKFGTRAYQPPEVRNLKHWFQANKVDIWGLGVTLFAMITGVLPYDEVGGKIIYNDMGLIKKMTVGDQCYDLVQNLLDPNPEVRYDITQVLDHPWCKHV